MRLCRGFLRLVAVPALVSVVLSAAMSCTPPPTGGGSGASSSSWQDGEVTTWGQGNWGDEATQAGSLLLNHYDNVYASTGSVLEVGLHGSTGYSMLFLGKFRLIDYLPSIGPVGALTSDLVNPSNSGPSGGFGGEVTALKLNIDFADAGVLQASSGLRFGDLVVCGLATDTDLNGKTVRDVLAIVSTTLGGGSTTDSIADLVGILVPLNFAHECRWRMVGRERRCRTLDRHEASRSREERSSR